MIRRMQQAARTMEEYDEWEQAQQQGEGETQEDTEGGEEEEDYEERGEETPASRGGSSASEQLTLGAQRPRGDSSRRQAGGLMFPLLLMMWVCTS